MNDPTLLNQLSLPQNALVFDLDALYACLQTIPDHRDPRGRQYSLAMLLMIGVLAKLAGQDSSRGMAHWAKLRTKELWLVGHFQFRLSVPIGSTGSLLDIASQLLESCPRASLIVLGSNARRNVLE